MVLGATGDASRRAGPPPTPAMRQWAGRLARERTDYYIRAVDMLENSLDRFIRADLTLAQYWLSVLTKNQKV
jgi:hypothetical protein